MATAQLIADLREKSGKGAARALRREGRVPAVVYGHAREVQALSIDTRDLTRLVEHFAVGSTVVELSLGGKVSRTLIREIQRHPLRRQILHVDFQELVAGELVSVQIPIVFVGVPEGVRLGGGMLDQVMHEVEIEADPSNIPDRVEVDVAPLQIGETIHVADLKLPEGVTVLDDGELTICVVQAPRTTEEEALPEAAEPAAAAAATGEPELIRKTKDDDEDEAK